MENLKTNNQIKKFSAVQEFTTDQLKTVTQYRVEFLKKIYPFLDNTDEYNDGCIEVRPLYRNKDGEKSYIRSFNAWHIEDQDIDNLYKLGQLINGKPYCLYYSLYSFDYQKKIEDKDKSSYTKTVYKKPGKINKENALFTTILGVDFDNIKPYEFKKFKQTLNSIGLQTLDVFTGHGVQSLILLDQKYYDTELQGKFVKIMFQKGFPVDTVTTDCARVFRMPYAFNCKEFAKNIDNPQAINTFVITDTDKRYSAPDVFTRLSKLLDVIPASKEFVDMGQVIQRLSLVTTKPLITPKKAPKSEKELKDIEFRDLQNEYPINLDRFAPAIKKMMCGTPETLRNAALLFLVPFFKNTLKLSLDQTVKILKVWDKHCLPPQGEAFIAAETKRLWHYDFKNKFGKYTAELKNYYGEITFEEYKLDNVILIPNIFFKELKSMADGSVQIYLSMLLSNKIDNIKEWTAKEICQCAQISQKTFYNNFNMLVTCGYVDKSRSYKKGKEDYIYRINSYKYCTGDSGYTKVEIATVRLMLKELTKGEIPLYLFLRYMISSTKNECYASQEYISKMLGKKRPTITINTTTLHQKHYIKKTTIKKGIISHSVYTLLI